MIIKMMLKKLSNVAYKILLLHKFRKSPRQKIVFDKSGLLLIVIAFNNLEILKKQYEYLKKFLIEPFDYIIADNSDKEEMSSAIESFCYEHEISYIKIPKNPLTGLRASGSHGIALNWVYKNVIEKYPPTFFGFLDHDIFPIKEVSIEDKMDLGFYGTIRNRKEPFWYMWPGFSFFEYEKIKKYSCDFSPHHAGRAGLIFLDTGGSNYYSIYRHLRKSGVNEAQSKLVNSNTGKEFIKGEDSSQTFEIIDNAWLHLRQIAWRPESANKMAEMEQILRLARQHAG